MMADYDVRTIQFLSHFLHHAWRHLYQGIRVDVASLERVRSASVRAQAGAAAAGGGKMRAVPTVYLPTHRSHVDYLIMSYVFYAHDLALPHIAAGDNLMLPLIGLIFRTAGAFFLGRGRFAGDPTYAALFNEYVTHLLSEGHSLEFFAEGGRNRIGKLRKPKLGMLALMAAGVASGRISDCNIVPVCISYDRVVEDKSFQVRTIPSSPLSLSLSLSGLPTSTNGQCLSRTSASARASRQKAWAASWAQCRACWRTSTAAWTCASASPSS
jgi:glycerol-3-phosphate O-acyltransferase